MECPKCHHLSRSSVSVQCPECGQIYPRTLLEEYEHIRYALHWLNLRRDKLGEHSDELLNELQQRQTLLRENFHISPAAPPNPVGTATAPAAATSAPAVAATTPVPTTPVRPTPMPAPTAAPVRTNPPAPVPPAAPPVPRAPQRPPIDWNKLLDRAVNFVVSGALLRALLYLGAFMIVISATVLVVRFWAIFPPVLQIGFIFAIPTAFYAAGWLIRTRLKLPQAGIVITGIGSGLVAVDFAALYQLTHLNMAVDTYWLLASLLILPIYAATAYLLDGEFFDYLAYLAVFDTLAALTRVLYLPAEWTLAAMSLCGLAVASFGMAMARRPQAARFGARAARFLPQVLVPLSLTAVVFVPTADPAGQLAAFLLAAAMYGGLAWKFPTRWALLPALLSGGAAAFYATRIFDTTLAWYGTPLAFLSASYIFAAWRWFKPTSGFAQHKTYRQGFYLVGFSFSLLAIVSAGMAVWQGQNLPAAIALSLVTLSFCAWNILLEQPLLGATGLALFFWPFGLWLNRLNLPPAYFQLDYALLISFVYVPVGLWVERHSRRLANPFYWVGFASTIFVFVFAMVNPFITNNTLSTCWTLLVLTGLFIFGAWRFKLAVMTWAASLLLPCLAISWLIYQKAPSAEYVLVGVGLGFVYLLVERFLASRQGVFARPAFRLPMLLGHVAISSLLAWILLITYISAGSRSALDNQDMLLSSLGLLVILNILSARLYRQPWLLLAEPLLSGLLTVWYVSFFVVQHANHDHSLTIAELSITLIVLGWVHLAAAIGLDQLKSRYAAPLHLAGYGLIGLFTVVSIAADRATLTLTLGLTLLAALLSALLVQFQRHPTWDAFAQVFGPPSHLVHRLVRGAFIWLCAWLLPIWVFLLLDQLQVNPALCWLGLSIPAILYLWIAARLNKLDTLYGWAFYSAALTFSSIALLFSLDRVWVYTSQFTLNLLPPTHLRADWPALQAQALVQFLSLLFYTLWTVLRRQTLFAHLAAWVSLPAFTSLLYLLNFLQPAQFAIAWMVWASLLMLLGLTLDQLKAPSPRYAHGPYLTGILLTILVLLIPTDSRLVNIITLGLAILSALVSFGMAHFNHNASFADFISLFGPAETLYKRGVRLIFLFFSAIAFPFWLMLVLPTETTMAVRGGVIALLAPAYILLGLLLRRVNRDYTWPLYSAGYAFTALASLMAFEDLGMAINVLALNLLVYAASAWIFRQVFWLYLVTFLAPLCASMVLEYNQRLDSTWLAWTFVAFMFLYFGAGQLADRLNALKTLRNRWAIPFYLPALLLSIANLLIALSSQSLTLGVYLAVVLLYALSAWRFRQPLFLYPAAWLAVVPYHEFILLYLPISQEWHGLTWLPLILAYIALARFAFPRVNFKLQTLLASCNRSAVPFYIMGYALSLYMAATSQPYPLQLTLACAAAALLYLGSARLFKHPAWLYPTLLFAHFAILAYFSIEPSASPARMVSMPFMLLTWVEALIGLFISRRYAVTEVTSSGKLSFNFLGKKIDFGSFPSVGFLVTPSWAQPVFGVVVLDVILWESLALTGLDTGLWVSFSFFLLAALFSLIWQDHLLPYISLSFGLLAVIYQLDSNGLKPDGIFSALAGLAFLLYMLSCLVEKARRLPAVLVWRQSLYVFAIGLSLICMVGAVATTQSTAIAITMGFAGALYLTLALRIRAYPLGYLGMGLLLASWSIFLFIRNVDQPQFYALPAGLYFAAVGFFERRNRPGRFAILIESFGLAVLLVTSYTQSLNGSAGLPYFLILLVESLLVVWWGAARRYRVPFIIGLVASVVNIISQAVVLVRVNNVNQWIVTFGVGLILVSLGLFVERRREKLLAQAHEFRDMLESWD
jgi:hypothetical protein